MLNGLPVLIMKIVPIVTGLEPVSEIASKSPL